ncbi:MAG: NB-ARC domain-containing protein [Xenococcaceae cyanobacterium]
MNYRQERRREPLKQRQGAKERRRGVILTPRAYEKLQKAKLETEISENNGISYTLEALSDRIGLDSDTLIKVFTCKTAVDRRTLSRCFQAFNLSLEPNDYYQPALQVKGEEGAEEQRGNGKSNIQNRTDWGEAPDISIFHERIEELATLTKWIQSDRCRLMVLLGMGGIGKTWLAAKLAKLIKDEFEFLIWRSLRNALPAKAILAELLGFLSKESKTDLPKTPDSRISLLISYLQASRCLLVLDNFETILQGCTLQQGSCNCFAGQYCQGYEGYGQLLRVVGETPHQSCVLLTSREKPKGIGRLEGERLPVRVLKLKGLQVEGAQKIFEKKGVFRGSQTDYTSLIEYYAGNPLVLTLVSTTIQNLFDGNIAEFLNQNTAIFGDICALLDQQFERLSGEEKEIMTCLAMQEKTVSVSDLRSQIEPQMSAKTMLEGLESLEARSLLTQRAGRFSLEPMLMDYVILGSDKREAATGHLMR